MYTNSKQDNLRAIGLNINFESSQNTGLKF